MKRFTQFSLFASLSLGLAACGGGGETPTDTTALEKAEDARAVAQAPSTPGSLFNVDYEIIGTPIVGSPVSIDLAITSTTSEEPVDIGFQVPDPSALAMEENQLTNVRRMPGAGERIIRERVTVIPQREGRLFINVKASHPGDEGTATTMISIPIHVGNVDTSLVEVGEVQTNEQGETRKVLRPEN